MTFFTGIRQTDFTRISSHTCEAYHKIVNRVANVLGFWIWRVYQVALVRNIIAFNSVGKFSFSLEILSNVEDFNLVLFSLIRISQRY